MGNVNNYITALWLIAYLPKMACLWVRENWRPLALALGCVLALFVVSYNLGSGEMAATNTAVSATSATYDGGGFGFEDLSAAFATGEKRTMQVELVGVHHTAGNPYSKVYDLARYQFGVFGVVAYHFLVMPDGTVYQLRPLDERVPHAYGCNDNSIAVCLAGNFDDYPVPDAQRTSALQLVRWIMSKYNLGKDRVLAHRELKAFSPHNATDCCGKLFNINKFRSEL